MEQKHRPLSQYLKNREKSVIYSNKRRNKRKRRAVDANKESLRTKASWLKERGNRAYQEQDYATAIQLYTESLAFYPNDFTVYSNRSVSHLKLKHYQQAYDDACACVRRNPNWVKGYLRKGLACEALTKYNEAILCYEEGLVRDPNRALFKQKIHEVRHRIDGSNLLFNDPNWTVGGTHPQTTKLKRILSWLRQAGAKFPKLYLKYFGPEQRAIFTKGNIENGEQIMYIPHECILTSDVAKVSPIGQAILKSRIELRSKHSLLAAYLLSEKAKGSNSRWAAYIDILPSKFETVPIFFDLDLMAMLRGSLVRQKIHDRKESLRIEFENLWTHVPEFRRFTHKEFVWARLVVITRIFGLMIGKVKTDGLVPLADMLNHKRPRETKWSYENSQRGFVINALCDIGQHSEVLDSYGRKCNSRFFVNYGFALECNDDNEASITCQITEKEPSWELKMKYINVFDPKDGTYRQASGLIQRDFLLPRFYKEKKTKEVFSFLRFANATDSEMMLLSGESNFRVPKPLKKKRTKCTLDNIRPLSCSNERKCLLSIANAAKKSLARFETSLETDLEKLKDYEMYPLYSNRRNCIIMRVGEKRVLHHYVNLADKCVDLLRMSWQELKIVVSKKFRHRGGEDEATIDYVHKVITPLVRGQNTPNDMHDNPAFLSGLNEIVDLCSKVTILSEG